MFEELENNEKYVLTGLFAFSILAAFGAGSLSGPLMGASAGEDVSQGEIEDRMNALADQQVEAQEQQLDMAANQSENVSREELSISSEVESVERSDFDSLYEVTLLTSGTVPDQLGSGTEEIDERQTLYVSSDGRYLFQEPTDLEAPTQQQPQQEPAPQQPAP